MIRRRVLRSSLIFAALFAASTLLCARSGIADDSAPRVQWSAFSTSPTRLALDVAEELLSRGAYPLAERKLDEARDALAEDPRATDAERLRYGTLAPRSKTPTSPPRKVAPRSRNASTRFDASLRRVKAISFAIPPPSRKTPEITRSPSSKPSTKSELSNSSTRSVPLLSNARSPSQKT